MLVWRVVILTGVRSAHLVMPYSIDGFGSPIQAPMGFLLLCLAALVYLGTPLSGAMCIRRGWSRNRFARLSDIVLFNQLRLAPARCLASLVLRDYMQSLCSFCS